MKLPSTPPPPASTASAALATLRAGLRVSGVRLDLTRAAGLARCGGASLELGAAVVWAEQRGLPSERIGAVVLDALEATADETLDAAAVLRALRAARDGAVAGGPRVRSLALEAGALVRAEEGLGVPAGAALRTFAVLVPTPARGRVLGGIVRSVHGALVVAVADATPAGRAAVEILGAVGDPARAARLPRAWWETRALELLVARQPRDPRGFYLRFMGAVDLVLGRGGPALEELLLGDAEQAA